MKRGGRRAAGGGRRAAGGGRRAAGGGRRAAGGGRRAAGGGYGYGYLYPLKQGIGLIIQRM